jgi:hypothetical protein
MSDWHDVANRGVALLSGDSSQEAVRTVSILQHILNESNSDGYISCDFYTVQQTAGGLDPASGLTIDDFIQKMMGHVRQGDAIGGLGLTGSSFDSTVSDDDLKTALLTFDATIRQHITFLNGVVHQIAPGEVHLALWNWILAAREDPTTLYGDCYHDYLQVV